MDGKLRKSFIVMAIVSAVLGLLCLVFVAGALISLETETPLSAEAKDTMYRAAALTGEQASLAHWQNEVEQGHLNVSDFVRIVFTGHRYLLSGKDDSAFAADLACVAYNDAFETKEIEKLLSDGSRNYAIETILTEQDARYTPINGYSDPKGTTCSGVEIFNPLQNEEGYAFGIRKIDGAMTVAGNEVRADFFVDNEPRAGQIYVPQVSGQAQFTMEWDTHGEAPGRHNVVILLRTSDGRGQVMTGGEVMIPACFTIMNDCVHQGSIESGTNETWYVLDAEDRDAYVNIVDASADISATLYDRYGNLIGENDLHNTDRELLRGKAQTAQASDPALGGSTESNEFFVRVRRSSSSTPSVAGISYMLVQSREVAVTEEGEYLAVLSDVGAVPTPRPTGAVPEGTDSQIVTCRTLSMRDVEYERGSLKFLPLNGYLAQMAFSDAEGNALKIYPEFTEDNFDYSIVGESFSSLSVSYLAREGYAATVTITNLTEKTMSAMPVSADSMEVKSGRNDITLEVRSIDGSARQYTLHVLNGQDSEGFARDTLSAFPKSYADGLWLLHCLHPEYRFEPYKTNLTFEEVLDNEDSGSRSLISDSYNPTWVKPGSPVYDGKTWRAAKREVVAYFLDPRNFLTPTGIFQFEKLSFDSTVHTKEGISAMTKNSFLEADDPDYTSILMEAGEMSNVSPYFLASRILQEMGRNGQSKLASGTLSGYEGYYNFYNIGSTPDPSVQDGALINGAKYAMYGSKPDEKQITPEEEALLLPWTSPEKAICGGAMWIARSYIEIGQDTLYFQKFDVIDNKDGIYIHQYAQNIAMAMNEGIRYYTAYASQDMLDSSFVFIIPIYEEMPNDYGTLP